jgi:hypothetical protein
MASLEKNAAGLRMATLPLAAGPMQEMAWEFPLLELSSSQVKRMETRQVPQAEHEMRVESIESEMLVPERVSFHCRVELRLSHWHCLAAASPWHWCAEAKGLAVSTRLVQRLVAGGGM